MDWAYYRKLFPVCEKFTYLIAAAVCPFPLPVLEIVQAQQQKFLLQGGNMDDEFTATVENCRGLIGQLIHAAPDEIAFIPNTSFGMNALAHSLRSSRQQTIVTPSTEFPSSTLPWENIGYSLHFVDSDDGLEQQLFNAASTIPNALVVTTLMQSITGYRIAPHALGAQLASRQIPFILNATQGAGVFPIDVEADAVDALLCTCRKWLFTPGIAFMYIRKSFFQQLKPAMVGWLSTPHAMTMKNSAPMYFDNAKIFEIGTLDLFAIVALAEALKMILAIGVENISKRVLALMDYLITELQRKNVPVLSDLRPGARSAILLLGPFADADRIVAELKAHNILVTQRGGGVRIALHFFNNEDDIDRLIAHLSSIKEK